MTRRHAILWTSFDMYNEGENRKGIKVLQYDAPRGCKLFETCDCWSDPRYETKEDGFTMSRVVPNSEYDYDPLTCYVQFGFLLCPCWERVVYQPEGDFASGLYHLFIDSKHLTNTRSGDNGGSIYPTGRIRLIGLAPDAGVVVESLRSGATANIRNVLEMERDLKPKSSGGCTIM